MSANVCVCVCILCVSDLDPGGGKTACVCVGGGETGVSALQAHGIRPTPRGPRRPGRRAPPGRLGHRRTHTSTQRQRRRRVRHRVHAQPRGGGRPPKHGRMSAQTCCTIGDPLQQQSKGRGRPPRGEQRGPAQGGPGPSWQAARREAGATAGLPPRALCLRR